MVCQFTPKTALGCHNLQVSSKGIQKRRFGSCFFPEVAKHGKTYVDLHLLLNLSFSMLFPIEPVGHCPIFFIHYLTWWNHLETAKHYELQHCRWDTRETIISTSGNIALTSANGDLQWLAPPCQRAASTFKIVQTTLYKGLVPNHLV